MGDIRDRIAAKLTEAFAPVRLDVTDESAAHAGHADAPEGGESHFHVLVVSDAFTGKSRLDRQRAVNAVLAEELAGPVHALRMTVRSPSED
jgi:BolA protein